MRGHGYAEAGCQCGQRGHRSGIDAHDRSDPLREVPAYPDRDQHIQNADAEAEECGACQQTPEAAVRTHQNAGENGQNADQKQILHPDPVKQTADGR